MRETNPLAGWRGCGKAGFRGAAVLCVLSVIAGDALGQAPRDPSQPPPALVRVAEVDSRELQKRWDVIGRLQEVRTSIVAAEVAGKVVELGVEEGDPVIGGETMLARIDELWAKTALVRAKATLDAARGAEVEALAQLNKSESDLEEVTKLIASGAAKRRELAEAQATHDANVGRLTQATANISAAAALYERAQREVERLVVLAPFDGTVTRKLIEVGEWVDQGDPVMEIVSRGQIDALVHVPEQLVNSVQLNEPLTVYIEPVDLEVIGTVRAVIPKGVSASRTFPVKIRLDDDEGKLKAGMSVIVRIPTGERTEVLTVPRDAVLRTVSGAVVWVLADGRVTRVAVKVLFGHEDRYAIEPLRGGIPLAVDMQVVIEGAEDITFSGQPAKVAVDGPRARRHGSE